MDILTQCGDRKRFHEGMTPERLCDMLSPIDDPERCIPLRRYLSEWTATHVCLTCIPWPPGGKETQAQAVSHTFVTCCIYQHSPLAQLFPSACAPDASARYNHCHMILIQIARKFTGAIFSSTPVCAMLSVLSVYLEA